MDGGTPDDDVRPDAGVGDDAGPEGVVDGGSGPSVDAGEDRFVFAAAPLVLNAVAAGFDGDDVTFAWRQVDGSPAELSAVDSATLELIAPGTEGFIELVVTVTQGSASAEDSVFVWVDASPFDLAEHPTRHRSTIAGTEVASLAVANGLLFVIDDALRVFDVSDPTSVVPLGSTPNDGFRLALTDDATVAYLGGPSGLSVIDASDPEAPAAVADIARGRFAGIAQLPDELLVLENGVLQFYDTSNAAPTGELAAVGSVATAGQEARIVAVAAGASGNIAVCAGSNITVVDVDDRAVVGSIPRSFGQFGSYQAIAFDGRFAYLAERSGGGVVVVDVSVPSSPAVVASIPSNDAERLALDAPRAVLYVARSTNGVDIVDVTSPTAGAVVKNIPADATALDVAATNSGGTELLFVADGRTLRVFDVSTPADPIELGAFANGPANITQVVAAPGVAAISTGADTRILDVANPAAPTLSDTFPFGGWAAFDVSPAGVLVAAQSVWLGRYDIAGGTFDPLSGSARTGDVVDLWQSGGLLYAALEQEEALQVFDLADPLQPVPLPAVALQSRPGAVAVSGSQGAITFRGRYSTIDATDPRRPVVGPSDDVFGSPRFVAATESTLLIGSGRTAQTQGGGLIFLPGNGNFVVPPNDSFCVPSDVALGVGFGVAAASPAASGFALCGLGLQVWDPAPAALWRELPTSEGRALAVADGFAFVGEAAGVRVVEVGKRIVANTWSPAEQVVGVPVLATGSLLFTASGRLHVYEQMAGAYEQRGDLAFVNGVQQLVAPDGAADVTTLYARSGNRVVVVDATDLAAPVARGSIDVANIRAIAAYEQFLIVLRENAAGTMELVRYDVSDVTAPAQLGAPVELQEGPTRFLVQSGPRSLALIGRFSLSVPSLFVVDWAQAAPAVLSSTPVAEDSARVQGFVAHENFVYAIERHFGTRVGASRIYPVDLTDPSAPIASTPRNIGQHAADAQVVGEALIVRYGTTGGGADVFDLSALGVPRWVAGHDGWGFLQALRATPDGGAVIQTRLDGSQHVSALSGGVVITRTAGVVSAGDELVYAATWTDRSPSAPERVRCVVSGGTCAVTRVDQDTHAAVVRWTLPSEEGGYELIVAVGNSESFESARLGVAVHD